MRLGRLALVSASIAGSAAAFAVACSIYDKSLLLAPSTDAQVVDAKLPTDTGDGDGGCVNAVPPEPPSSQPSDGQQTVVFAADSLRIDALEDDGGTPVPSGLDLDLTCTCPGPPSCINPLDAGTVSCDGPGGRDKGSVTMLTQIASLADNFRASFIRSDIAKGNYTLLFRLERYNGEDNDRDVGLAVFPSNGTEGVQEGKARVPKFDGSDVWTVDPLAVLGGSSLIDAGTCDTVPGGCRPIYVAENAFVRDGWLYARIDLPISVTGAIGTLTIDLVGGGIQARIDRSGPVRRLTDLQITGRWPIDRMLKTVAGLRDPFQPLPMCTNGGTGGYLIIKQLLCETLDVTSDKAKDRTNATCDAISTAIAASAVEAQLGSVYNRDSEVLPCPQFTDKCR
jgi:hypothetical protein